MRVVEMRGEPFRADQRLGPGIGHRLLREGDIDAAVLPALVLDLGDRHRADLGGVAECVPPALQ